ncbi:MAG: hypothetical protein WCV62_05265 [Candidatus Peribacteraceae bacterium]|jgi:hypothetical protein
MSGKTITVGGVTFPIPTGTDVYDALMGQIEPDLLTAAIPGLEEKYRGVSEAQRKERFARYSRAYKLYDEAFRAWSAELQATVTSIHRQSLQTAEMKAQGEDDDAISKLESQIGTA